MSVHNHVHNNAVSAAIPNLDPAGLLLSGRHLIEASAGTGKTFNITRLYLRLLLERRLPVQQILVMTFTKAATEELRGRIDRELRHAAAHWGRLGQSDPFFAALEARVDPQLAPLLLHNALLHLDEAAIFTIHGFCARVLRQHALASDLAMELEMEADTSEQALEAVRDWLRGIAHQPAYQLLSERGWHTPEAFMALFGRAIRSQAELLAAEPQQFIDTALTAKQTVRQQLLALEGEIDTRLISSHKEVVKRGQEWETLLNWLGNDEIGVPPKLAMDFVNGNRYRKDEELKQWLQPFKDLKEQLPALAQAAKQAAAYPLVRDGIAAIRARFAAAKTQQGLMDFDDLISLLAERVSAVEGAALVSALRNQYPVALVDEFQDTDPHQYAILERVYPPRAQAVEGDGKEPSALFMIGDPKQAIYSFRGGDIFTYLNARHGADNSWQMDTNWRSVPAMVQGYNRLFWGGALGQPAAPVFGFDIAYEPVKAAKAQQPHCSQLQDPLGISAHSGEDARAALNYVWLTPQAEEYDEAADKVTAPFRHAMASWCCAEIHRLLCETRLGAVGEPGRALEERDIAILVRTGTEAAIVQQALLAAGYPSVYLSARDNIFASAEAAQLAQVLQGILACEETRHLIAAYATELLGGDAALLAQLNSDADALVAARTQLLALRARWQRDGFIPMMLGLIHDHLRPPPARHERCLTNHIHLAELLQQASGNLRHPQQLLEWLRDQIATAGSDSQAELRLESDANLIRIITQHGSKGLEYPVVFVPFANYGKTPLSQGNRKAEYIPYHDPASGVARELIGRTPEAVEQATAEAFAESIRLLYVAVTRAEQRCYLCCAPFGNSADSPLARTLGIGSWGGTTLEPEQWPERLAALVADDPASSALLCLAVTDDTPLLRSAVAADASALAAAEFSGRIERDWRISSFSALTRNLGHSRRDRKDHDDDAEASNESGPVDPAQLPLRFRLAKGAHAGNLLHDVLEHTDFSAPRWEETLRDPLLRFGQLSAAEQTELQGWLQECLATALPPILSAGGDSGASADALSLAQLSQAQLTLAQLTWPHTLREAEFYFPLNHARLSRLADILRRHRGSYDTVELPGLRPLQGMMHGYIDLIFEHQGRFYVADYKSTHLGNRLGDYGFAALQQNNEAHFYDLQYLIYALALHRYLRDRVADYDPARHLGGVYYLYLRGMAPGSDSGVYHCPIDTALLTELDQLFGGIES